MLTPRRLTAMIDEWEGIERARARTLAFLIHGGTLPETKASGAIAGETDVNPFWL